MIVLPANSGDLALSYKQLAVGHKDTFCDPQSQNHKYNFTASEYTVIEHSESATVTDQWTDYSPVGSL